MLNNKPRSFWTRCQYCRKPVFYYENEIGSKVFFDEIGPPWPKHECPQRPVASRRTLSKSETNAFSFDSGPKVVAMDKFYRQRTPRQSTASKETRPHAKQIPSILRQDPPRHKYKCMKIGTVAFLTHDADIFKKSGLLERSMGAHLLGNFVAETLAQITLPSRAPERAGGSKDSYTFFVAESRVRSLDLREGMVIEEHLRGVSAIASRPIWVCERLTC